MRKREPGFREKVIAIVAGIRKGKVMTYKNVAKKAGKPKAARAVAPILRKHYRECRSLGKAAIPCHRVICSDGTIGGYIHGAKQKRILLEKEGAI